MDIKVGQSDHRSQESTILDTFRINKLVRNKASVCSNKQSDMNAVPT